MLEMIEVGQIVFYRDRKLDRWDWGKVVEIQMFNLGVPCYFWEVYPLSYLVEKNGVLTDVYGLDERLPDRGPRYEDIVPLTRRLVTWNYRGIEQFQQLARKMEDTIQVHRSGYLDEGEWYPDREYCRAYWESPDFGLLLGVMMKLPDFLDLVELGEDFQTRIEARKYTYLVREYQRENPNWTAAAVSVSDSEYFFAELPRLLADDWGDESNYE